MGGHALSFETNRMDAATYAKVKSEVIPLLGEYYTKCVVPFEKPGKKDHGDLDVICLLDKNGRHPNGCDPVKDLGSKESTRNGHIISFEYQGHRQRFHQ